MGWESHQPGVGRAVGGRRWSQLFLGHLSSASSPGASPQHYSASVRDSVKLGPALQRLLGISRISQALCRWPHKIQDMADGARANPKGFRKKVLVKRSTGQKDPRLRASPSKTSR